MTTKLPAKIEPERLKDTIVEIKYQSDIPFEYRLGLCHKVLIEQGFVVYVPTLAPTFDTSGQFFFLASPKNIFANNIIRVHFEGERIIFNSNGVYQGWTLFSQEILSCLDTLLNEKLVSGIHWLGLRYISEFESVQIFDQLEWRFDFSWAGNETVNTSFRTEWIDGPDQVIVNLLNNARRDTASYSLIDLDVSSKAETSLDSVDLLAPVLSRIHEKEKKIFFGLMKESFLQSLQPTYL